MKLSRGRFDSVATILALLAAAWLVPDATAQQSASSETATFNGVVVDALSGAAIPGAAVILIERAKPVITDREGRFSFPDVQLGTRTLIVTQLGYDSLRTNVEFTSADEPVAIRMTADPVVLERVAVLVDRLESRRRSLGSSVRVFDQIALQSSASYSVLDLIMGRTGMIPMRCPGRAPVVSCAYVRGRPTPVQVFIDGASIIGGLDMLASIPPYELYTVEVIGGGRAVRIYTNWFMETVAEGRRIPTEFMF